jgi:hypothetical protein
VCVEQKAILPYALSGGDPLMLSSASDPIQDEDLLITEMQAWGLTDAMPRKHRLDIRNVSGARPPDLFLCVHIYVCMCLSVSVWCADVCFVAVCVAWLHRAPVEAPIPDAVLNHWIG